MTHYTLSVLPRATDGHLMCVVFRVEPGRNKVATIAVECPTFEAAQAAFRLLTTY